MERLGLKVFSFPFPPTQQIGLEHFYTSAIATAKFLSHQTNGVFIVILLLFLQKGGKVYCVGEPGLQIALYEKGFILDEIKPDYVVIGEGRTINFDTV